MWIRIASGLLMAIYAALATFVILYAWNFGAVYLLWFFATLPIGFAGLALEDRSIALGQ